MITAHCDGGSRGNPGPAGFGAVLTNENGETIAKLSQYLGIRTNNYAEYSGLLAVLNYARQSHITHLKVFSDSQVMVRQVQGEYKVNSPSLKPLWSKASELAVELGKFEITHTLRAGNKDADRLANMAMDRGKGVEESAPVLHFSLATSAQPKETAAANTQIDDEIPVGDSSVPATSGNVLLVDGCGKVVATAFTREVAEKIAATCGYVITDTADGLDS